MKESDFELSVLFADNDKLQSSYSVYEGPKSLKRKFIQCFPTCINEHSHDKFCGSPTGVVLGITFRNAADAEAFNFNEVVFIGELKPANHNHSVEVSISKTQLTKLMKQSGCIYLGTLMTTTKSHLPNDSGCLLNGYYEFALNTLNLPDSRKKEGNSPRPDVPYTLSVTVLMPVTKEERVGVSPRNKGEAEVLLHPVAHFDSASFTVTGLDPTDHSPKGSASSGKCDHQSAEDLSEARSLIGLYHTMQNERMAVERRSLHTKLNAAADAHPPPPGRGRCVPSQLSSCCKPLDLVTEDIMEMIYESNALSQRPFAWQSTSGKALADPTVEMMCGLVGQSALEKALFCITKHNSIIKGDITLEDEPEGREVEMELAEAAAAETEVTADKDPTEVNDSSSSIALPASSPRVASPIVSTRKTSTRGQSSASSSNNTSVKAAHVQVEALSPTPITFATSSSSAQKKPEFLSLEFMKEQLVRSYQDPCANLLQRQFFSDMLQSLTETALQSAVRIGPTKRRAVGFGTTAYDLFCAVMGDIKEEHRELAKAFLASEPPPLRALNWATRFLRSQGELTFTSSAVDVTSCWAESILQSRAQLLLPDKSGLERAFADSMNSEVVEGENVQGQGTTIPEETKKVEQPADYTSPMEDAGAASTEALECAPVPPESSEPPAVTATSGKPKNGKRRRQKEESDGEGDQATEGDDQAAAAATTTTTVVRDPEQMLAQFKALVAEDAHKSAARDASASLALVALMSDFVCTGGYQQLKQRDQHSADLRDKLQQHVQKTFTSQRALLHEAFIWEKSSARLNFIGRSSAFFANFRKPVPYESEEQRAKRKLFEQAAANGILFNNNSGSSVNNNYDRESNVGDQANHADNGISEANDNANSDEDGDEEDSARNPAAANGRKIAKKTSKVSRKAQRTAHRTSNSDGSGGATHNNNNNTNNTKPSKSGTKSSRGRGRPPKIVRLHSSGGHAVAMTGGEGEGENNSLESDSDSASLKSISSDGEEEEIEDV